MIHFYCLAVKAGFYSDVVDFESGRPGSIPGRGKCDLDFSPFLLYLLACVGVAALEPHG